MGDGKDLSIYIYLKISLFKYLKWKHSWINYIVILSMTVTVNISYLKKY